MSPVKTGVTYIKEIIMDKVKQVWALAKANPKIATAILVVVVVIYFLVN